MEDPPSNGGFPDIKRLGYRMDVNKTLRELHEEKRKLDATIAALEAQLGMRRAGRRGRKSMSQEERLAVSKRMSKYWESRRASMRALENITDVSSNSEPSASA